MENKKKKTELTPEELENFKHFIRTLDEKKLDNWKESIQIFEKYFKEYSKGEKLTDFETWILNSTPEDIRNFEMFLEKKPGKPKFIKQGMHSVKQEFGKQREISLFDDRLPLDYSEQFGIEISNEIVEFGTNLNVTQRKLMYGILKAFTETDYKGNIDSKNEDEILKEHPKISKLDKLPKAYKNVREIPRIEIGQRELLRLAGIDKNIRSSAQDAIKALGYLATHQYCFYWVRSVYDKDGKLEKDWEGDYKKERVMTVDTLFKVNKVTDDKTEKLKKYVIAPSVVFLDQIENYYLLIPYDWMQEIEKKVGKRKASTYFFSFIPFVSYQFEAIRRYNNNRYHKDKKPYTIRYSWEYLAQIVRMPESIFKRKRARALKILDEVYQTAQELGYLVSYERTATVDILELNQDKYPTPDKELNQGSTL